MVFTQIALTIIGTCLTAYSAGRVGTRLVGADVAPKSMFVAGLVVLIGLALCLVGMAASWELAGALLHSLTAEAVALGV